jgi:hypothetical protein
MIPAMGVLSGALLVASVALPSPPTGFIYFMF